MQRRGRLEGARLPGSMFGVGRRWALVAPTLPSCGSTTTILYHPTHMHTTAIPMPTHRHPTPGLPPSHAFIPTVTTTPSHSRMHNPIPRPSTTQPYVCVDFGVSWKLRIEEGDVGGLAGYGGLSEYPFSHPERSSRRESRKPKTPLSYL